MPTTNWSKPPMVLTDNPEIIYMKRTLDDTKAQLKIAQARLGTLEKKSGKFNKAIDDNKADIEKLIATIEEQTEIIETLKDANQASAALIKDLDKYQTLLAIKFDQFKRRTIVIASFGFGIDILLIALITVLAAFH